MRIVWNTKLLAFSPWINREQHLWFGLHNNKRTSELIRMEKWCRMFCTTCTKSRLHYPCFSSCFNLFYHLTFTLFVCFSFSIQIFYLRFIPQDKFALIFLCFHFFGIFVAQISQHSFVHFALNHCEPDARYSHSHSYRVSIDFVSVFLLFGIINGLLWLGPSIHQQPPFLMSIFCWFEAQYAK